MRMIELFDDGDICGVKKGVQLFESLEDAKQWMLDRAQVAVSRYRYTWCTILPDVLERNGTASSFPSLVVMCKDNESMDDTPIFFHSSNYAILDISWNTQRGNGYDEIL